MFFKRLYLSERDRASTHKSMSGGGPEGEGEADRQTDLVGARFQDRRVMT